MRNALRRLPALALGLALTLGPTVASACPVCMAGERRTLMAFFGTAVLLSVLPFVVFGAIAFWLYRCSKAPEAGGVVTAPSTGAVSTPAVPMARPDRGFAGSAPAARATT